MARRQPAARLSDVRQRRGAVPPGRRGLRPRARGRRRGRRPRPPDGRHGARAPRVVAERPRRALGSTGQRPRPRGRRRRPWRRRNHAGRADGGRPLVVVPLFADQAINGASAAAAGAAVVAHVEGIRAGLERVLSHDSYREAAGRIAAELHALPPVDKAFDALGLWLVFADARLPDDRGPGGRDLGRLGRARPHRRGAAALEGLFAPTTTSASSAAAGGRARRVVDDRRPLRRNGADPARHDGVACDVPPSGRRRAHGRHRRSRLGRARRARAGGGVVRGRAPGARLRLPTAPRAFRQARGGHRGDRPGLDRRSDAAAEAAPTAASSDRDRRFGEATWGAARGALCAGVQHDLRDARPVPRAPGRTRRGVPFGRPRPGHLAAQPHDRLRDRPRRGRGARTRSRRAARPRRGRRRRRVDRAPSAG